MKSIGKDAPKSLNDKIKKGIDNLFENQNSDSNTRYVIDEDKFGQAYLSKTRDGRQMSDDWVKGRYSKIDRILNAVNGDEALANDIKRALKNKQVDKVLSRVDAEGNVTTFKLDENGKIIGPWP